MACDRGLVLRTLLLVALLAAALVGFILALLRRDLGAARVLAGACVAAATVALVAHVERTSVALTRFVEVVAHRDLAAHFDERGGTGLPRLGAALNDALRRLRAEQARVSEEGRFWEAVVDDAPVALVGVDAGGGVQLLNKAARRLFDRHDGAGADAFAVYGPAFAARIAAAGTAGQEILSIDLAAGPQRALVRGGTIARLGAPFRVIAVEPVQAALDAVEVGTQDDIVRVLAHEMMNSLTPITSLAGTASALLEADAADLADARLAVTTLARRAEGLRRFVESYRAIARPLSPRRRRFAAEPFVAELTRLFAAEWPEHRLDVAVAPGTELEADPDLLAQALLNLLLNAAQATAAAGSRAVRLAVTRHADGATAIEVEDDGPGVPDALRREIFLPFFSTRAGGSGIGLLLVRQITVAHGWRIEVGSGAMGGARFRLSTP